MKLKNNLQNALETYTENVAIEVENRSITYAELKNQSLRLLTFFNTNKNEGGGANIAL